MSAAVGVGRAADYTQAALSRALKTALAGFGGLESVIPRRSKVFLKINGLSLQNPVETGIYTHPRFSRVIAEHLLDLGCEVKLGDELSSAEGDVFAASGYRELGRSLGIKLVNLRQYGFREIEFPGQAITRTFLSNIVLETDYLINLPKLKTHSFTAFTGAVKNWYGVIPHGHRQSYHNQFRKPHDFSAMLVDIYAAAPPQLTVMDAVVGMEGEGPGAGRPIALNWILAGRDAVAVDAAACHLVGIRPLNIYTTRHAHDRRLGVGDMQAITITGEDTVFSPLPDFQHSAIAIGLLQRKIPQLIYGLIQDQLSFIPEVRTERCTSCAECVNICPTGAASLLPEHAAIDKHTCIHCMCCHEMCPSRAIRLRNRPGGAVIRGTSSTWKRLKAIFSGGR